MNTNAAEDLLKRIKQLGEKSTQVLIFLSFTFVAVVTLGEQRGISESQQKFLTYAMRWWICALPIILFCVLPVRDFVEFRCVKNKGRWYNVIRWCKVGLLTVAVILISFGSLSFGHAVWHVAHAAAVLGPHKAVSQTTAMAAVPQRTITNMQKMSFWQLALNSPEWVGVFANVVFAGVTIGVLIWQVRVMKWLGRNSEHHERIQNRLIRLQHEHEWVLRANSEREQILKVARKLHLAASSLKETPNESDSVIWKEVQDTVYELAQRLQILDLKVYDSPYDNWYPVLEDYVDAMQKSVIDDGNVDSADEVPNETPSLSTRKALKDAGDRYNPIRIFLDLETAIRMECFDFKSKWDGALTR